MFKQKPKPTYRFMGNDEDHPNRRFAVMAWAPIDPEVPRLVALVARALDGQIAEPSRVLQCLRAIQPVGSILRRDPCECGRPGCEYAVGALFYSALAGDCRDCGLPEDLMVLLYFTYVEGG
jgi:hypothetical protein